MRLTALVRGINGWFGRVVYERDQWDEKLEQWSKESNAHLAVVLVAARGSIWISRSVLTGLMMAGHAISCFMLRQMEYDADSYDIKLAGSAAFARASTRMRELSLGAQFGYVDLREGWRRRTLPSNLPAFLVKRSRLLSDELLRQVRHVTNNVTGIFDTHPSDADRVRAAEAAAASGILVGADGPAIALFRDFEALSAAATRHYYEYDLGLSLGAATFLETERAIQEANAREESYEATHRFFGGRVSIDRPLHIATTDLERLSAAELRTLWRAASDTMAAADAELPERYRRFELLQRRQDLAFSALEVLSAGFSIARPADFDLPDGTVDAVVSTQASAIEEQEALAPALERFEEAAARRLSCCVCLLRQAPDGAGQAKTQDSDPLARQTAGEEAVSLINALNAIAGVLPHLRNLRQLLLAESLLGRHWSGSHPPDQLQARIGLLSIRIQVCLEHLLSGLNNTRCPPAFTSEPMTLAARCGLSCDAPADGPLDVADRVFTLYFRMLSRLVSLVQTLEATQQSYDRAGVAAVPGAR